MRSGAKVDASLIFRSFPPDPRARWGNPGRRSIPAAEPEHRSGANESGPSSSARVSFANPAVCLSRFLPDRARWCGPPAPSSMECRAQQGMTLADETVQNLGVCRAV